LEKDTAVLEKLKDNTNNATVDIVSLRDQVLANRNSIRINSNGKQQLETRVDELEDVTDGLQPNMTTLQTDTKFLQTIQGTLSTSVQSLLDGALKYTEALASKKIEFTGPIENIEQEMPIQVSTKAEYVLADVYITARTCGCEEITAARFTDGSPKFEAKC
jgi:chromosome segregation ATPase